MKGFSVKWLTSVALLFFVGVCGCSTSSKPPPPQPPGSNGFRVEERSGDFYHRQPRPIPPDAYRPRVDYQSELRIVVDTNELNRLTSPASDVLPPLTQEQKNRLDRLSDLLKGARNYLEQANAFNRAYDARKSSLQSPETQKVLINLINRQGRAETNYLQPLMDYVDARTLEANPAFTHSQVVRARDRAMGPSNQPLFPTNADLDFAALSDFIAAESAAIVRQASLDARAVRDAGSVFLRLRATQSQPGRAEIPLHILNYDTLSDANVQQEPRISFQMSDDDRKRLDAETKVNNDLVHLIGDVQNSKSEIRQSFDSLLTALRGDLSDWKAAVTNLDTLKQRLGPVVAALDKAGGSTRLTAAQSNLVSDARSVLATATNTVQQIRDTISSLIGNASPGTDPADVLMGAVTALSSGVEVLPEQSQKVAAGISRVMDDLHNLLQAITPDIEADKPRLQDLADALKAGAPGSAQEIAKLLDLTLRNYPNLVAELKSLKSKAQIVAAASNLPPIQLDPALLDIALANPPDGFISLRKNVVRGDVTVTLDAALVTRKDPATPPAVRPAGHQEFAAEKFGCISTWEAPLIFVRRLGNLDPNERKVQFAPAPSVSWTLHYNPPPDPARENTPPSWFWKGLDPGAGVNVAALSWDNGVQVGLGGHLSVLHDLLTVGGGWNLNESRHGGYVFIGIGIFRTMNQLGLTGDSFPLGR